VYLRYADPHLNEPLLISVHLRDAAGEAAVNVAASTSGTASGKCVKDNKVKDYKEAAADYEQKGLLDYSMDEDGGGEGGEPDENLLNVDEEVEMDTDPVGTDPAAAAKQVSGAEQVTVGVQAKADGSVFITQEELMDKEMRRMLREEKKKQAAAAKLSRLESAKEAKQLGRELAGKAKIDHRYYAVRSLRANRPTGRELNRQSEGGVDKVLENSFLGGGDERWLRNYNIHNLETQSNISCSFNPRTGFCYTCSGEPHRAMQGRGGRLLPLFWRISPSLLTYRRRMKASALGL
jgi:hypothetical protein